MLIETVADGPALWFSYGGGAFTGTEPAFYDPAHFDWVGRIEGQWEIIRDELLALLRLPDANLLPYPNTELTANPEQWKTFALMFWLHELKHNIARCPNTWRILKTIPGLSSASFSLLAPHTTIKPHRGDTNAIMRCHLGLAIPAAAPACALQVAGEVRSWREGELLMFCDAHEHSAWNETALPRYVLIVDVIRQPFIAQREMIARRVVAAVLCEVCCHRARVPPILRRGLFYLLHCRIVVAGLLNRITR